MGKGKSGENKWNFVEGLQEKKSEMQLHAGHGSANQCVNDGCPHWKASRETQQCGQEAPPWWVSQSLPEKVIASPLSGAQVTECKKATELIQSSHDKLKHIITWIFFTTKDRILSLNRINEERSISLATEKHPELMNFWLVEREMVLTQLQVHLLTDQKVSVNNRIS